MNQSADAGRALSVVLRCSGAGERLEDALTACRGLRPAELVVLADDLSDRAAGAAAKAGGAIRPLGLWAAAHPTGWPEHVRTTGDAVLYVDADAAPELAALLRLVEPVLYGRADAALPDGGGGGPDGLFPSPEPAWAACLNRLAGRADLRAAHLYAPAFALSRRAAEAIGPRLADNPAAAMMRLLAGGFRVERRPAWPTGAGAGAAPFRPDWFDAPPPEPTRYDRLVAANGLDALAAAALPPRGGCTDDGRRRDIVRQVIAGERSAAVRDGARPFAASPPRGGPTLSVIVPARNEEAAIAPLLREIRKLEPAETIVVVNGSDDRTAERAFDGGAKVVSFAEPLGTDAGRAIGASAAAGDILLFVDGDLVVPAAELYPFVLAVRRGGDIALNDRNDLLLPGVPGNPVTSAVYALNLALGHKALGASTMSAVPFALSRRALRTAGAERLQCPPLALAACLLEGLRPALAGRVRLDKRNRVRPDKHFAGAGLSPAAEQLLGDHLEALYYAVQFKKSRGS